MSTRDRPFLSIGDVLERLRPEFPDASISKIRFLESQGLIEPERTPSGYRKFYERDVERLRYILRRQRESYLPLRVIREELDARDGTAAPAAPVHDEGAGGHDDEPGDDAGFLSADAAGTARHPSAGRRPSAAEGRVAATATAAGPTAPVPLAAAVDDEPAMPDEGVSEGSSRTGIGGERRGGAARDPFSVGDSGVSLTLDELVVASGLSADDIGQLESFGLLSGQRAFSAVYYDEDALIVARAAAGFRRYGVEPRHLRMYKTAAEREGAFFETLVIPLLRKRSPDSRRHAAEALVDLARLGEQVRHTALRRVLRTAAGAELRAGGAGRPRG